MNKKNLELSLGTKQCLEIAKMVYKRYRENMSRPTYRIYRFDEWLDQQLLTEEEK